MVSKSLNSWTPKSWQSLKAAQQPDYENSTEVEQYLSAISSLPPLVSEGEVDKLLNCLASASKGEQFLLQGGDCAERFQDCKSETIRRKLGIILQMSLVLAYGARRPIIRVGRIAGQYAKPRSSSTETVDGVEMPTYRGDIIHGFQADPSVRRADPSRLLSSYHYSALTLNYVRALIRGGFADLHYPEHWNLSRFGEGEQKKRYQKIVDDIENAIDFMEALGGLKEETIGSVDFFSSHEGLLLGYEEALTRKIGDEYYNLGAHMLWIGDRTRQLDGAHVEYFRGIKNPIGIKVGPSMQPDEAVDLVWKINANNTPGRVTLITRFGADRVDSHLPKILQAIKKSRATVVWSCDPMHGNTVKSDQGIKTRSFDDILRELRQTFDAHRRADSNLAGVHFEMTGDSVTECIGGAEGLESKDLATRYETFCDPRLNYSQSLEMAFLISNFLGGQIQAR